MDEPIACIFEEDKAGEVAKFLGHGLLLLEDAQALSREDGRTGFWGIISGCVYEIDIDDRGLNLSVGVIPSEPWIVLPRTIGPADPRTAAKATLASWLTSTEHAVSLGSAAANSLSAPVERAAILALAALIDHGRDAEKVTIEYDEALGWLVRSVKETDTWHTRPTLPHLSAWANDRLPPLRRFTFYTYIWQASGGYGSAQRSLLSPVDLMRASAEIDDALLEAVAAS